ncbi:hypothetical protein FRB91_004657 [Serendipita sp. 411]|nr:hypothetical protein FRB91_004657 [Serendipita sp. 411]
MPRLLEGMESAKYRNLRSLLQWDRERAKATVLRLQQDSKQIIEDIEDEMIRLHGFKWKVVNLSSQFVTSSAYTPQDMDWVSRCSEHGASAHAHNLFRFYFTFSEKQKALQFVPSKAWFLLTSP